MISTTLEAFMTLPRGERIRMILRWMRSERLQRGGDQVFWCKYDDVGVCLVCNQCSDPGCCPDLEHRIQAHERWRDNLRDAKNGRLLDALS